MEDFVVKSIFVTDYYGFMEEISWLQIMEMG